MLDTLYDRLLTGGETLAVVGLGYVGMPLAVALAGKLNVIGFDINQSKIDSYRAGIDVTNEIGSELLQRAPVKFTSDPSDLAAARFYIVAVPTPVDANKAPDLTPVVSASRLVGKHMQRGSIVVFESTVYPGVTEDICVPILEAESGLKYGEEFKVGYSPERINPGDKTHTLQTIPKIVSGGDPVALSVVKKVYNLVVDAGTYDVSSIRTAEAIKVAENSQRDINIAFMNELAMVFDRMGIDTNEVVDGMNTKWNALGFRPGLVGGHCISVDPYYFTHQAERLGYHSQIVAAGRKVNDSMGQYVADAAVRRLIQAGMAPKGSRVVILGITFKEDCPDTRNTKVIDVVRRLQEYGICPTVVDPWADRDAVQAEYGIGLTSLDEVHDAQCVIVAVAHASFRRLASVGFEPLFIKDSQRERVLVDVKGMVPVGAAEERGYLYWRL